MALVISQHKIVIGGTGGKLPLLGVQKFELRGPLVAKKEVGGA